MFNDKAKEILGEYTELSGVSEKILKALCYVYNKSIRERFDKDLCKFFYFWLGNILLNKLEERKKQFYIHIIINIFKSLNSAGNGEVCELPHIYIHEDDFDNIKRIFDYSEDYSSYKEQITGHNPPCNQDYKKYLQTYVNSYKTFYDKCNVEGLNDNYCEAFRKYFDGKDKGLLATWTCDLKIDDPRDNEFEEEEVEDDANTETQLQQASPRPLINTQHRLSSQIFSSGREARATVPGIHDSPLDGRTSVINSNGSSSEHNSSTIISKIVTGAVSVAGALVPSYLLYNVISK
ncbi:Plasmodium vivax Vir protein, putative [Plasmodium vivax]|uniref:Vir protein, putative n=1 Tax=Plasmodium vivax TaxID=5855 RepID=A0A1G4EGA5_PLAVI|nr:Plasmodium vivax Vir protein, putative [Plasmodium vivax]